MTDARDEVPPGLADLPLEVRAAREAENRREIEEGLARRHLAVTAYDRAYLAFHFHRLLRAGYSLAAKLRN